MADHVKSNLRNGIDRHRSKPKPVQQLIDSLREVFKAGDLARNHLARFPVLRSERRRQNDAKVSLEKHAALAKTARTAAASVSGVAGYLAPILPGSPHVFTTGLLAQLKAIEGAPIPTPETCKEYYGRISPLLARLHSDWNWLLLNGDYSSASKTSDLSQAPESAISNGSPRLSPSRLKAKSAYDWAIENIPEVGSMTYEELFHAIKRHPQGPGDALPEKAETFERYLRGAGISKNESRTARNGRSIVPLAST